MAREIKGGKIYGNKGKPLPKGTTPEQHQKKRAAAAKKKAKK